MLLAGTVIYVAATYLLMIFAFKMAKHRKIHVPIMATIIVGDLLMPFYLFFSGDWYQRLIVNEDILTFGIWMHFFVVVTLYVLYVVQIQCAMKLLKNTPEPRIRAEHRAQGLGILLTRFFVLFTGALLVPDTAVEAVDLVE